MYDLNGKVALVTGAGGEHGIGRAIATRLATEGADVIVNDIVSNPYANNPTGWEGAPSVVREIEALGRQAMTGLADVSDASQVERMVHEGLERFGHIDILVNNAGSRPRRDRVPVVDLEESAWDKEMNINAKGPFLCCRAVARHMIDRGEGGKIINMSSTSGKQGRPRFAAYCASKFAVIGFTQSLAQELAAYRINVNAICPAAVDTERVGYIVAAMSSEEISPETWRDSERRAQMIERQAKEIPFGRAAQGADIAKTAAFLASAESDYLTGLAITVAGGSDML
ncbi:MAG: glucose 1-dehydrogenase [Candidatus Poribacteria bacterium]|nr:glucose 1-dehydrogenase [Candidatus Poribacteria bacterium]